MSCVGIIGLLDLSAVSFSTIVDKNTARVLVFLFLAIAASSPVRVLGRINEVSVSVMTFVAPARIAVRMAMWAARRLQAADTDAIVLYVILLGSLLRLTIPRSY